MKPDAKISFILFPSDGRVSPIRSDKYGCPLLVDGNYYDCRFILPEFVCYELGSRYEVDVKFLSPELVVPKLCEGMPIELWEGKAIGLGTVLEIYDTAVYGNKSEDQISTEDNQ